MTKDELRKILEEAGAKLVEDQMNVLCDGEMLAALGVGDEHIDEVEELYSDLNDLCLSCGIRQAYQEDFCAHCISDMEQRDIARNEAYAATRG